VWQLVGDVEGSVHGISFNGSHIVMLNLRFYNQRFAFYGKKVTLFCNILLNRVRVNHVVRSVNTMIFTS
jgi:hypothetical protein